VLEDTGEIIWKKSQILGAGPVRGEVAARESEQKSTNWERGTCGKKNCADLLKQRKGTKRRSDKRGDHGREEGGAPGGGIPRDLLNKKKGKSKIP